MKSLSHVWLFATPWTAAYQAPLSMGFSRQEYWSGMPYVPWIGRSILSDVLSYFLQSWAALCNPMDSSPPGSSVHGILQVRILEWVAMPSSRGSSQPRDQTQMSHVSCIGRWILCHWVLGKTLADTLILDFQNGEFCLWKFAVASLGRQYSTQCRVL